MPTELECAIAFVARREGLRSMPAARWAHVLSLDLGWMPPGEARAFVARCVEAAILRAEGEELRVAIDPATVEVPRGFRPGQGPASSASRAPSPPAAAPAARAPAPAPKPDPFLDWVDRLATHDRVERAAVVARVTQVQERMGGQLTAMAAILWLAARAGMDVREAAAAELGNLR